MRKRLSRVGVIRPADPLRNLQSPFIYAPLHQAGASTGYVEYESNVTGIGPPGLAASRVSQNDSTVTWDTLGRLTFNNNNFLLGGDFNDYPAARTFFNIGSLVGIGGLLFLFRLYFINTAGATRWGPNTSSFVDVSGGYNHIISASHKLQFQIRIPGSGTTSTIIETSALSAGTTYNVVAWWDGVNGRTLVYIDGALLAGTNTWPASASAMVLGPDAGFYVGAGSANTPSTNLTGASDLGISDLLVLRMSEDISSLIPAIAAQFHAMPREIPQALWGL